MARKSKANFKMKGHSIPGVKGFKNTTLKDGRAASSAFQYNSPLPHGSNPEQLDPVEDGKIYGHHGKKMTQEEYSNHDAPASPVKQAWAGTIKKHKDKLQEMRDKGTVHEEGIDDVPGLLEKRNNAYNIRRLIDQGLSPEEVMAEYDETVKAAADVDEQAKTDKWFDDRLFKQVRESMGPGADIGSIVAEVDRINAQDDADEEARIAKISEASGISTDEIKDRESSGEDFFLSDY